MEKNKINNGKYAKLETACPKDSYDIVVQLKQAWSIGEDYRRAIELSEKVRRVCETRRQYESYRSTVTARRLRLERDLEEAMAIDLPHEDITTAVIECRAREASLTTSIKGLTKTYHDALCEADSRLSSILDNTLDVRINTRRLKDAIHGLIMEEKKR